MKQTFCKQFLTIISLFIVGLLNANGNVRNIVEQYNDMSTELLYNKGVDYTKRDRKDSALVCFSVVCNRVDSSSDIEELKVICKSFHSSALIYYYNCNYDRSLDLLLRALDICDKIDYKDFVGRIYNSIGNVYSNFKEYDISKRYYLLACHHASDKPQMYSSLNNLGTVYCCKNNFDSALYYLDKSYKAYVDNGDSVLYKPLSNLGLANHRINKFDKALDYYRKGLNNAVKLGKNDGIASLLSNIGQLYYDTKTYDSALVYLTRSNDIAKESGLLLSIIDNYKYLSIIEEQLQNYKKALEYDRQYFSLYDSVYNISKYSNISEKQFLYEMSKVDKQIEEMSAEQRLKENKIVMQQRTQVAMIVIILAAAIFLLILFRKNKTLHSAYGKLVDRTLEITKAEAKNKQLKQEYEETILSQKEHIDRLTSIIDNENSDIKASEMLKRGYLLKDEDKTNILLAIEKVMDDSSVFCNSDFSLEILSDMINSNSNYVSQVINDTFGKNFRSYINEYRIKEALRLFSSPDHSKYSIETISEMVGFKSKSTFNKLFLKATGVTPSFYFKSMHSQSE